MKFLKFKNEILASTYAKDIILTHIKTNKHLKLGLATGSTPITLYKLLVEDHKKHKTSWAHVTGFNLDEYAHVDYTSEISYHKFMAEHLYDHVNIKHENTYFPDLEHDYDKLIVQHNKIDLQILGIGVNGHIGFNEPGSKIDSLTRLVDLAPSTIAVNAQKFFNGDINAVPKQAISMGLGSIMHAKEIILLAFGKSKTEAIKRLKHANKFDPSFPASVLVNHPHVTIIIDEEVEVDI